MIDPFTAFAMAQGAVKGIKAAMQLGKDVSSLYNEFSTFYHSADAVHTASTKMRIASIGKTNAQIGADSLKIALASKALRDNERELKDILFWSGNAPVWEEMMAERTRMTKERNAMEKAIADKKQRDHEALYNLILNVGLFIAVTLVVVPFGTIMFHLLTK